VWLLMTMTGISYFTAIARANAFAGMGVLYTLKTE
jgi:hypothetical protein